MKKQIAAIVAAVPHDPPLTVYHELEPDLYSVTSKTFIGRIYTMLGLKDIADAADKTGPATRSSRTSTSSRPTRT